MKPAAASPPDASQLAQRAAALRQDLAKVDPALLAARAGIEYFPDREGGELHLPVWGSEVRLPFPALSAVDAVTGRECPLPTQALLLYYLATASGQPLTGRWVSFADLPGGRFYNQAFQGYTGGELRRVFGDQVDGFALAARQAGGQEISPAVNSSLGDGASLGQAPSFGEASHFGDAAFTFLPLPRVPLLVIAWQGDEDFPSSYQVLFDASASAYLPTDVCAIFGSMLTRRILSCVK